MFSDSSEPANCKSRQLSVVVVTDVVVEEVLVPKTLIGALVSTPLMRVMVLENTLPKAVVYEAGSEAPATL